MILDYKILKNEAMTATGSQILRAIQNNDMPKLDLLTREVIQNSLDAKNGIDNKVGIRVNTGTFDIENFTNLFGKIGELISSNYSSEKYNSFISFSDVYTTGLTGPLVMSKVSQNDYGKYLNLVFNIGRAQSDIQAGGSWGYGKTVFYRMGIGLVVFYTRVFEDNQFKSRLIVSFVQDDKKTIIPSIEEHSNLKTGIMWFGNKSNNEILPIENENEINQILSHFNIQPYVGTETGTTIIMPYIDKEDILSDTYTTDEDREPWCYSIEEYIKVSVQRWYAPRLMNPCYEENPYIELSINGRMFDIYRDFLPLFKTVRDLYNISIKQDFEDNEKCFKRNINVRNVFENVDEAGKIVFTKLSKRELEMLPPENNPSPYAQIKNSNKEEIEPIITFCRKPGMLLKYDINENWSSKINIDASGDEYIIGLFVANSNNSMKKNKKTFEEYLRNCEKADHTNWTEQNNSNILRNIQNHICSKINKTFEISEIEKIKGVNSKLTRELTNIFLPKTGFGFRPNALKIKKKETVGQLINKPPVQRSNIVFLDDSYNMDHIDKTIDRDFVIKFSKRDSNLSYKFQIVSEMNNIDIDEWKSQFFKSSPINITRMTLLFKKDKDDIYYYKNIQLNSNINDYKDSYLEINKVLSHDTTEWIGWNIRRLDNEIDEIRMRLTYKVIDSKLAYEIVKK